MNRASKTVEERFIGNAFMFNEKERARILKNPTGKYDHKELTKPFYDKVADKDDVTKMQYIDINFWLIGDILLKADKMSMAHSLEVRVPFLDKEVFNVARTIPTKYKVNKSNTKYAMRQAAHRHLPDMVAEKKKLQEELFAKIHVGDVVEGTVKNLTDFGAFIDLGGADGLLHISEMSWGRVENPKKVFNVGDKTKVLIKDIKDDKIALSLKFEDQNPWLDAEEKYGVGSVVKGKVARMADFGAFVELEPGVDALLHVSQISKDHVDKPSDVLKVGQEVEAKVVDFKKDEHKISLSMKALLNDSDEAEEVVADTEE